MRATENSSGYLNLKKRKSCWKEVLVECPLESDNYVEATGTSDRDSLPVTRTENVKNKRKNQAWWPTPVISTPGTCRQEEPSSRPARGTWDPVSKIIIMMIIINKKIYWGIFKKWKGQAVCSSVVLCLPNLSEVLNPTLSTTGKMDQASLHCLSDSLISLSLVVILLYLQRGFISPLSGALVSNISTFRIPWLQWPEPLPTKKFSVLARERKQIWKVCGWPQLRHTSTFEPTN